MSTFKFKRDYFDNELINERFLDGFIKFIIIQHLIILKSKFSLANYAE